MKDSLMEKIKIAHDDVAHLQHQCATVATILITALVSRNVFGVIAFLCFSGPDRTGRGKLKSSSHVV